MSIRADHFRDFVVKPTLKFLADAANNPKIDTPAAVELVMGTVAHESLLGVYLRQHPTGPARGVGQMEPATYADMWQNYLKTRPLLADAVRSLASGRSIEAGVPDFSELIGNLYFMVAMIRIRYLPAPAPLPAADDLPGLAAYHVKFYNRGGDAESHEFVHDYKRYVLGEK